MATTPVPRIHSCTATRRRGGGCEIVIRGSGLSTGTVPIVAYHEDRRVADARAVSSSELRVTVDTCRPGDRLDVDLGPLGTVTGSVASVTRIRGRPVDWLNRVRAPLGWVRQSLWVRLGRSRR